ncbi:MAG: isoprenyl transferase [Candidatus Improbicoccus pseudotrichonymphae]|uniref:Isoprenyl transferase n=1 Tax=Candidatus Improbicoccus pseudotrichonymphae TaxID=3033792 RepID=A0AA48KVF2_9FIRM|nr:MAG: isoprenyl transferase [Candidatus Improbicoccus pseudotrichonymphae]
MNEFPLHIGIIMDGNRRWAEVRKLPRSVGHIAGLEAFKKIVSHCEKIGLRYLTVYAFSTENWCRQKDEVNILMNLFKRNLEENIAGSRDSDLKINFIGELSSLPENLMNLIKKIEDISKNNKGMVLNIALSYSARGEIVHAIKKVSEKILNSTLSLEDIDENVFSDYLYTCNQPEPDLIIRTGGEFRISNFLLWQAAYAEFWFTNIFWPDFKPKNLDEAILDFRKRERRFGKF